MGWRRRRPPNRRPVRSAGVPRPSLRFLFPRLLADVFGQVFPTRRAIPSLVHLRLDLALNQELGELAPLRLRLDAALPLSLGRHLACCYWLRLIGGLLPASRTTTRICRRERPTLTISGCNCQ